MEKGSNSGLVIHKRTTRCSVLKPDLDLVAEQGNLERSKSVITVPERIPITGSSNRRPIETCKQENTSLQQDKRRLMCPCQPLKDEIH